jgi:hypothetical protein
MNPACTSEPVSFLRLERYLQGDLQERERERVAAHLRECKVCSACFQALREEVIELPALPAPIEQRIKRKTRNWTGPLTLVAAAAAALIFAWIPKDIRQPAARVHIKGGELAIELVREHAGALANDPLVFAPGDRFEVRLSCPPQQRVYWDVAVFQGRDVYFPLQPEAALSCANGITLPGAFELSGSMPASVCVQIESHPLDRERARRDGVAGLARASACVVLTLALPDR